MIKNTLLSLIVLVTIFAATLVAINVIDTGAPSLPEPKKPTPTSPAVEAYKYLLGIQVAYDKDPLQQGSQIYERIRVQVESKQDANTLRSRHSIFGPEDKAVGPESFTVLCSQSAYCPKKEIQNSSTVQSELKASQSFLKRFDKLISYGSYGSDLKPSLANIQPDLLIVRSLRAKLIQWSVSLQASSKNDDAVLSEIQNITTFLKNSLQFSAPLMGVTIKVMAIKRIKEFAEGASQEHASFAKKYELIKNNIGLTKAAYKTLAEDIITYETLTLKNVLDDGINSDIFPPQSLSPLTKKFFKYLYKKNETLKTHYENLQVAAFANCVTDESSCPNDSRHSDLSLWQKIKNPIGNALLEILKLDSKRFEKIYNDL